MRQSRLFTKSLREFIKEEGSVSAQLLERGGFIQKQLSGAYNFLPLGWRVVNKGFGTMLLNQIEHCAKERGLTKIYLYTFTAESLYRRCGWKELDRVMYKDHDTVIMEKML